MPEINRTLQEILKHLHFQKAALGFCGTLLLGSQTSAKPRPLKESVGSAVAGDLLVS